jgi:cellulose synthase/poly-beta-1,6-N-acetylglucosamine synthase-like glycosyltransferase
MFLLILFWVSVAIIIYTYLLFPMVVILRGLMLKKNFKSSDITPRISLIVAAYNEEESIEGRIENVLSLDYPQDHLEVIIASDGSTDDTNAIVRRYARQGIRLLSLPRTGKTAALNAAVESASGEIIVFSDANSIYAPDALQALVRPFADPEIGGVAGDQRYLKPSQTGSGVDGERSYWNFDRMLKRFQSRAGNVISATGAIYAIRRELYQPIPAGAVDDFVTSTRVIAQGYRLVFVEEARAFEPVSKSTNLEFARKIRVINQGLVSVYVMRELLNLFKYGFYSIQLFSHKVLRRLVFLPMILIFFASLFLWGRGPFYQFVVIAQFGFYGMAVLGMLLENTSIGRSKIFSMPYYFCAVYTASLLACLQLIKGDRVRSWETQPRNHQPVGASDQIESLIQVENKSP